MQGGLVSTKDAVGLMTGRVVAAGTGGVRSVGGVHVLETLLSTLLGVLGDVRVVDRGLETGGDAGLCGYKQGRVIS